MKPDFLRRDSAVILGHRGVRGTADAPPENTLGAFEQALREGADGFECDVRLSADGKVIVLHDPDLTRVTGSSETRQAAELELAALRRLDLGGGEKIPTLEETLSLARDHRAVVDIELKHDVPNMARAAEAVAAIARRFEDLPLMFSSFEPRNLLHLARFAPRIPRALIVHRSWYEPVARVVTGGLSVGFCASRAVFRERDPARFPFVGVWTVNDADEAAAFLASGVDLLITDRPGLVLSAVGRAPERASPRLDQAAS